MAFNYDEINPVDSSYIADFPLNERNQRLAVLSSVNVDHDAEGLGEHRKVSLQRMSGDPTLSGNAGFLYTKVIGAITELFYEDHTGQVIQLTSDGSASPDKLPLAGGTMTGNLIIDSADLDLQGTSLIRLLNDRYIWQLNAAAVALRKVIGYNASDRLLVGDPVQDGGVQLNMSATAGIDGAGIAYGGGSKKIWHEGHFASVPLFTNLYESALITIPTGAGGGVVPHGISPRPKLWVAMIVCKTGEQSFIAGQEVMLMAPSDPGTARGITFSLTDTNFEWRKPIAEFSLMQPGGGGEFNIDANKWEMRFRAWY